MKNVIYFILIVLFFTACKQNANTETTIETSVATDSVITTVQAVEQFIETPKLNLPFIGKRWYSMDNPLAYGSGYSVSEYVEIKSDGSVYFGNIIETKGDKKHTSNYYAGKFNEIIPCNYKESEDFPPCYGFYKITSDTIYSVDEKGNVLKDRMCCTEGIPDEERKCKCQSKLSINNN